MWLLELDSAFASQKHNAGRRLGKIPDRFWDFHSSPTASELGSRDWTRLLLAQKSSVPPCSKNREQALDFYSLRRPVEPTVLVQSQNTQEI